MKNVIPFLCLVMVGTLALTKPASADLPDTTLPGTTLGLQYSHYAYQETKNGAFFMSLKGNKVGLTWKTVSNTLGNHWHAIWDFRYAAGNDAYYSASGTGTVPDKLWNLRIMAEKDEPFEYYEVGVSYFGGLGYRKLANDLTKLGAGGYHRVSEYIYIPLGITFRNNLSAESRLATSVEYDYFVKGYQHTQLSDLSPLLNDMVNNQHTGYGFRASMNYETRHWEAGLFYYYWHISMSDTQAITAIDGTVVGSGDEPNNTTKEAGVDIKWHF